MERGTGQEAVPTWFEARAAPKINVGRSPHKLLFPSLCPITPACSPVATAQSKRQAGQTAPASHGANDTKELHTPTDEDVQQRWSFAKLVI